ncbi:MAG: hypothetical protein HQL59_10500 [Magnetococcales bacterium]|nr:hypothetical protein [Magnetococcales bacterium]
MRWFPYLVVVLGLLPGNLGAKEYFQQGPFTVRKVEGVCKMEIALSDKSGDTLALLALFPTDEYYAELFTDRKRVGIARKNLTIGFDDRKGVPIAFVPDSEGKDKFWRWQYLDNSQELLAEVRRRDKMSVNFSNGNQNFRLSVRLTGSAKAVDSLRKCR